jgi:hypothetical protein
MSYTTKEQIIWKNVSNGKWTRFAFYMCGSSRDNLWGRGGSVRFVLMWLRTETSIRLL